MALAWAAWLAVCVIWGTTYLAIRISLETLPPAMMAAIRWIVASFLIAVVLWARRDRWPDRRQWPGLALTGLLMIGLGNGCVVFAQQYVPSGLAAVTVATVPFWMVTLEAALPDGERLTRGAVVGLIVGFGGILLLVWPEIRMGDARSTQFAWGIVSLQIACVGWALGSSYSRRHRARGGVIPATTLQMLFGGLLMLLVGMILGERSSISFSARSTAALLYLIVAGSVGGFLAYAYALRHLPVSTVSLYAYVNPVIAVILGSLVLNEPLTGRILAAAGIVLAGLAIVRLSAPPMVEPES
jgi:drug/metabolite transporter (DMT)-like permease